MSCKCPDVTKIDASSFPFKFQDARLLVRVNNFYLDKIYTL